MSKDTDNQSVETTGAHAPDIDQVDATDWSQRDFPIDDGRRENSVRVVIKQSVLNDIHRHGQTTTDVEICGVLVGAGYRDDRGPYVYIEANIRGQHSDSKAAQVTFTGETWNHIHNELDRDFPDLQILGWYHTHPGFGIFLSGMDLFIHENYFSGEHQLALVYDPIGGDEGLFVWRNGKALRDGFLIEPDVEEDPPPVATAAPSEPMTAGAEMPESSLDSPQQGDVDPDLHKRLTRIENRQMLAELGIFTAIILALAVPLMMWLLWIQPRLPSGRSPNADQAPAEPSAPETGDSDGTSPPADDKEPQDDPDANDPSANDTDENNTPSGAESETADGESTENDNEATDDGEDARGDEMDSAEPPDAQQEDAPTEASAPINPPAP